MIWGGDWPELNEKKVNGKPDKTNELILKRKPSWGKYLITYNIYPRIMFPEWLSFGKRGDFVWNWMSNIKGLEEFRMWLDKGSRGSWKTDNFHGRHMCIVSKSQVSVLFYDFFSFPFFFKKITIQDSFLCSVVSWSLHGYLLWLIDRFFWKKSCSKNV